ncbi:hypothetical protein BpHYR1_038025 [Brachionus plicatilis]|uniref:Uncharacterized protein n=1 Tax=Brachionus plicatilis TaxID=10195 RepID=A0A3M7R7B6_BRAPC|nr:hypothetical protein BpHYR1_038025 [Brachionus plicatilis]
MRKKTKKLSSFLVKKNCFISFILKYNCQVLNNECHFFLIRYIKFVISGFRYKEVRCIKEN